MKRKTRVLSLLLALLTALLTALPVCAEGGGADKPLVLDATVKSEEPTEPDIQAKLQDIRNRFTIWLLGNLAKIARWITGNIDSIRSTFETIKKVVSFGYPLGWFQH